MHPSRRAGRTWRRAQRAGEVTPEQVALIERALRPLDRPGYDPAEADAGERLLTGYAGTFEPRELQRLALQVTDAVDPDGSLPDEELVAERRQVTLHARRDGSYGGELRLTAALGAKLRAVLGPLARPRTESRPGSGPDDGNGAALSDSRHHGQRMHDALEDVCDRMLRSVTLPDSGGTPATVIVTIDQRDLRQRTGHGSTADGVPVSVSGVLRIAEQADVLPVLRTAVGAVLTLGRSRRVASPSQTCALIAREGGCSFPGCDRPPQWCERHHIRAWVDGGPTDLDNLTLLCRYHHHNFAARGLVLPAERRPAARVAPAALGRPRPGPPYAPPHPRDRRSRPRPSPSGAAVRSEHRASASAAARACRRAALGRREHRVLSLASQRGTASGWSSGERRTSRSRA